MGFITEGTTLAWDAAKPHLEYVKQHGIQQFLHIYKNTKDRKNDTLKWGDEIEYIIVRVDDEKQVAQVALRAHDALVELMVEEKENPDGVEMLWRPEYGRYMIEGTPGKPYSGVRDIKKVKDNMKARRDVVKKHLRPDERAVTLTNFPRLGCDNCSFPPLPPGGAVSMSSYLPDDIINPHFRFSTLTANIRTRRGSKVNINVPIFRDKNTPAVMPLPEADKSREKPFNINMDAMGFGMGACCLQCTFQCCNINEARHFYDQLSIISGPMLALTAATPILRGYLADTDVRWSVISQSVDDRTQEERGHNSSNGSTNNGSSNNGNYANGNSKSRAIPKSRYDSISTYISPEPTLLPQYNDLDIPIDEYSLNTLLEAGVDKLLARHFAHLFIRDPLVIYSDKIKLDDEKHSDHFENIQSTNWQTVRFKPPPPNSTIGWRVEFRPMEVGMTDFENAAFAAFIVLLTRVISSFELNLYIPISLVDENMRAAHARNAANEQKFHFRKNITPSDSAPSEANCALLTINEIMNGNGSDFPGLIPLIRVYLKSTHIERDNLEVINQYLLFISKRASGELMTPAGWIRKFVTTHPDYKHDSVVSEKITYDLVNACENISNGSLRVPELYGDFTL